MVFLKAEPPFRLKRFCAVSIGLPQIWDFSKWQ